MFTGFSEATLQFFLDLRFHNETSYFHANQERYKQDVIAPFYALIETLAPTMQGIDPQMEIRPYRCLSRIHRDTRFSKDKSPYRDHLWFLFRRAAEPRDGSVFYWFGLAPGGMDWGVGVWRANRLLMDQLRRQIAAKPKEAQAVLKACRLQQNDFRLAGSVYQRLAVPDTVPPQLNMLYRAKELYIEKAHPDFALFDQPALAEQLKQDYLSLAPMYHWLRGNYDQINTP